MGQGCGQNTSEFNCLNAPIFSFLFILQLGCFCRNLLCKDLICLPCVSPTEKAVVKAQVRFCTHFVKTQTIFVWGAFFNQSML